MKKNREETFTVAKIKIKKCVDWVPDGICEKRKDKYLLCWIEHGDWEDSFNCRNKREFWKRLKEEVDKHINWRR